MSLTIPTYIDVPTTLAIVKNAHYFSDLSRTVYSSSIDNMYYSFEDTRPFEGGSDFGIVGRVPGGLVVAFRGTDNVEDWWHDAKFRQVNDGGRLVHAGFYDSAAALWGPMLGILREMWQRDDRLWITGHSLGGAIATLIAKWLNDTNWDISGVYTFGQPRVGSVDFADKYPLHKVHHRFVNNRDFVPHVPYRWMGPGVYYKHVGQVYQFSNDGNLVVGDASWDETSKLFAATQFLVRTPGQLLVELFGMVDHKIQRYIERVEHYLTLPA